ncbi:DUF4190 domain-containing protein [Agromyces humatus]|uniref:DUF4190 domain-containing protein n=1 Tax=Agromyces humatus TaxID=279573 RepID=UPI001E4ACBC5|nr:DUF4190 domain-containing protein [Agromyces humatus]
MTDPNLPEQPAGAVPPVPPAPPAGAPAAPSAPAYGAPAAPAYGQPAPAYGQPAGAKTNVLAIISLIASIAAFVILPFIGSIAGVICGHIALSQIKKTGEQGRGMAVAGLIVGYVGIVLAIIGTIVFFAIIASIAANPNLYVN